MRVHRSRVVPALIMACALLGAACDSPTTPATTAAMQPAMAATFGAELGTEAAGLTPQILAERGWSCRAVPSNPALTQCSHPGQGFPAIPPPADRPATYTFLLWDTEGFLGQVLLIRPELYQGQTCRSTGQPWGYIALVGYHECLHRVGN